LINAERLGVPIVKQLLDNILSLALLAGKQELVFLDEKDCHWVLAGQEIFDAMSLPLWNVRVATLRVPPGSTVGRS
jgi:hypothetical protein